MVSHQCIQFQISLRCITLLNRISSYLICSSTHRKLVALNSKFLRFQSYEDHFLFRAKVAGFSFFMILVDTSQTKKVKSKSVSDMDFPDQSQCTSLLDLTPIYVYSEGRSQKRKCRNQIFWIRITLARRVSDYLGDIKGCLSSLGCLRVYRRAQSMWASVWPKPIHHFGTSPTCNFFHLTLLRHQNIKTYVL